MQKPSSGSRLPDPLVFLLDASLGSKRVADVFRQTGETIILVDDLYDPGKPDEEWLTEAGQKGWVVLSKDKRIRKRLVERQALLDHDVAAFLLVTGNMTGLEMAKTFENALPKIKRFLAAHTKPFIASVHRDGSVSLYLGSEA